MGKDKHGQIVHGKSETSLLVIWQFLVQTLLYCILEVSVIEEEEPRITKFNMPIKQVERKLKGLIRTLDGVVVKTSDGTHGLRRFLLEVVDEFRVESKSRSRRDPFEVTVHERLVVIRFSAPPSSLECLYAIVL